MYDLKVVIPVYNEEGAIKLVIEDWTNKLSELEINYQIITYNDGSKDNTLAFLKSLEKEYKTLKVVDKKNSGHGPTILKGYKDNIDAEWIFQVDSDNELKATEFNKFWRERDNFDFLIGKRIHRDSPLVRVVTTQISRLVVGIFYGFKVKDVNAPYRLMRVSAFSDEFNKIPADTFAPNLIVSGLASVRNMRIKQFDVTHHNRETGEVSIKKWGLFKAAFKSFLQTISFRFK
ncbi:glycosyltransferase family 2 protein [Polaribacter sp. Hel1_85]|uniref:glycosyltransferase family 2 protein n=1 Tax=Polaribacter sp. Hel1_85 TaxID=1250005 RepID=UPI00052D2B4A|nr:glycosyltransferase family 2 protein [Polaribacter sp. Hel1_85]KGL63241.1 glycosyltransferase, GT2 family [Polaribacter sp. Hel1_85]